MTLLKAGKLQEDFVEGMMCPGGCVGGPSKHQAEAQVIRDRKELLSRADDRRILENLENISRKTQCRIIVRCPIIPPCNDSAENMHALGRFLKEKNIRVSEINLLPYHNMGEGKREQLEPGTEGFCSRTPSKEEMEALRNILRGYGFTVKNS